MDVLVIEIIWYMDIPIATVYAIVSGDIFCKSLLHRSFVQRHNIGVGSEIQLSDEGCLVRVIKSSGEVLLPKTNTVFDRWFLFRRQLKPYISHGYARILFTSGIETFNELRDHRSSIGKIRGIGPVTTTRIQNMFVQDINHVPSL
jgi:hypothetical protein